MKESRKMSDKQTNEPVELTETLRLAFTAIVDHHVSIVGSILFLIVRLGDSVPSPPLRLLRPCTIYSQGHWRLHWHSGSDCTASIPPIPSLNDILSNRCPPKQCSSFSLSLNTVVRTGRELCGMFGEKRQKWQFE